MKGGLGGRLETVDLVWSGCVHRAGRGFQRCDREGGQSRLSTVSPIVPARPARVQGPGGFTLVRHAWVGGRPRHAGEPVEAVAAEHLVRTSCCWPVSGLRRCTCSAIVAGSVQLSCDGQIVRVHPIRHDRAKEHGAFATPNGRPRHRQDAPAGAGVKVTPLRGRPTGRALTPTP
jgi:hypothetical protein